MWRTRKVGQPSFSRRRKSRVLVRLPIQLSGIKTYRNIPVTRKGKFCSVTYSGDRRNRWSLAANADEPLVLARLGFGDGREHEPPRVRGVCMDKGPRQSFRVVAAEIKRTISSDDFWAFINALRQGRRLLMTGDHGYATACEFSSEIKDDESIRLFAGTFGAMRAIREDPTQPWPRRDLPPRVLRFPVGNDTWLVVIVSGSGKCGAVSQHSVTTACRCLRPPSQSSSFPRHSHVRV
jgi:hypothetical protein